MGTAIAQPTAVSRLARMRSGHRRAPGWRGGAIRTVTAYLSAQTPLLLWCSSGRHSAHSFPRALKHPKDRLHEYKGGGVSLRLKIDSQQSEQAHRGASRLLLISSGLSTCIKLVHQGYL